MCKMKSDWIVVTNSITKRKFYYHKTMKKVFDIITFPPKKYNYSIRYFNTLNKKDLTKGIVQSLVNPKRNNKTYLYL